MSQPASSLSKIEMELKIKNYKYVLFKLHKELEEKDLEIARLTELLRKSQQQKGV